MRRLVVALQWKSAMVFGDPEFFVVPLITTLNYNQNNLEDGI